jgi:signal transduction histidine kinase
MAPPAALDGGAILQVQDTGEGMSPEVLVKAVEPFFTTKPQGEDTGLGLAMVYGIMKAHEGSFDLHSRAGTGTEAVLRSPPAGWKGRSRWLRRRPCRQGRRRLA